MSTSIVDCRRAFALINGKDHHRCGCAQIQGPKALPHCNSSAEVGQLSHSDLARPKAACRACACVATSPEHSALGEPLLYSLTIPLRSWADPRQELASVTDQRVELSLRSADISAGKWLQEDPNLQMMQRLAGINTCNGR